nr:IS66 family transposase [Limobrevibacterium gyesilva]
MAYRTPEDEIAALRLELAATRAQLGTAALEIEHLRVQLAALRRQQYSQSSERLDADIAQLELRLEDLEENEAERRAAIADPAAAEPPRQRSKPVRKPLPEHLPRETVMHEPKMVCDCGDRSQLASLGEDVTEVLEKIPARLKVIRHIRPRYACRQCERVFQAPAPDLPNERGRPGPRLIAHVAVAKYCHGLPLFRQSVILAREGVEIDRATLADWIGRAAWWLAPVARLIGAYVMAQPVLHTDDTPIRTLAPGTGKTRLSRFRIYAVDLRPPAGPDPPAAFSRYSADRRGERPRDHLAGFSGVMHADAFTGYDALYRPQPGKPARIRHAAYWAHARRKLFDVHEATGSPIAEEALRRIQALYAIEAEITGKSAAHRHAERQARSKPLLIALKSWMEAQRRRASGKTVLGKVLQYALGRWEALTRYADDGRLAIDNNVAERLLRGIAVTRKNFLFIGSDQGGDRAAILYTLIETAKLNAVDPEAYRTYVIDRLASGHLTSKLGELLPWNCKEALELKTA